jgi:hypothetical protein
MEPKKFWAGPEKFKEGTNLVDFVFKDKTYLCQAMPSLFRYENSAQHIRFNKQCYGLCTTVKKKLSPLKFNKNSPIEQPFFT